MLLTLRKILLFALKFDETSLFFIKKWTWDCFILNPALLPSLCCMCARLPQSWVMPCYCLSPARLAGCQGMWDAITCWPSASVGEVVTITCPTYFSYFNDHHRGKHSLPQCMSMSAALQNYTIFRCRKIIGASVFMKKNINHFEFNPSSFFLFFPQCWGTLGVSRPLDSDSEPLWTFRDLHPAFECFGI